MIIQQGYGADGKIYFGGVRRQKGSGIGAIFGAIGRYLLPFFKQVAPKVLPHAAAAAKNIFMDTLDNKQSVRAAIKEHGKTALRGIGRDLLDQSGSGRRRRRRAIKTAPVKRKRRKSGRRRRIKRKVSKIKNIIRRRVRKPKIRYLF